MPESTNHNKQHSHSEWRKNRNRRKYCRKAPKKAQVANKTIITKKSQETKPGLIKRWMKRVFRTQSR